MIIIATSDRNYSALVNSTKMVCFYKSDQVGELKIRSLRGAKRILEIWSMLKNTPIEAQQLHEVSKDMVGVDIFEMSFSADKRTVLYRSKVIGVVG